MSSISCLESESDVDYRILRFVCFFLILNLKAVLLLEYRALISNTKQHIFVLRTSMNSASDQSMILL